MFKKIVVVAGIIFSSSAFAQAEKFAGASVGINGGFDSQILDFNGAKLGNDTYSYNVNGSYTFALSNQYTFGIGLTYDMGDAEAASATTMLNVTGASNSYKLKSHYSLNFEPGYAINEQYLAYLKLAYHGAKANQSDLSLDKNITGTGYGFGTKYFISKDTFFSFEVQNIKYNSYSVTPSSTTYTVTHKNTLSTIGIGYKF